jgi:hypothetical protein
MSNLSNHTQQLRQLKAEAISKNSLNCYINSIVCFILFLSNYDHSMTPEYVCPLTPAVKFFLQENSDKTVSKVKKLLKEKLMEEEPMPIVNFEILDVSHLMTFLITLKKSNGEDMGFNNLNTHRAGFNHLHRMYEMPKPTKMDEELTVYFKSFRKRLAKKAHEATFKPNTKLPLPFS